MVYASDIPVVRDGTFSGNMRRSILQRTRYELPAQGSSDASKIEGLLEGDGRISVTDGQK